MFIEKYVLSEIQLQKKMLLCLKNNHIVTKICHAYIDKNLLPYDL